MSGGGSGRTPRGFWPVWTSVAVDLLGFGIVIPLLPLYAERFGASPFMIGLLFASYSLAQFVASPVWGRLSDRIGRKPVLLITIAGSAVGSLILGLAGTLPLLFLGRIVDGASGASVAVARATVSDLVGVTERPRLMGLLGAAFGVGFVVGPALGGLAVGFDPRAPFLLAAAISAGNLVATAVRLTETRRTRPDRVVTGARPPVAVLRLSALTFVGVVAFSSFETTLALLGSRRLGMSDSTVALMFAGVGVILVAAQGGAVGPVARRLGEIGALRLGLAMNLAGFGLLTVAAGRPTLAVALALLAFGQGLVTPVLSSAVAGAAREGASGGALGVQQSAGGLGRVFGPLLGGALFAVSPGLPSAVSAALIIPAWFLIPRPAN